MIQLSNGTRVYYGLESTKGDWTKIATIRGFTYLKDGLYYVLETDAQHLIVRYQDWIVKVPTSLVEYIATHCETKCAIAHGCTHPLQDWIQEALDSYE